MERLLQLLHYRTFLMRLLVVLFFAGLASCAVVQNNGFIARSQAMMGDHYHVYSLPFEKDEKVWVVQGYESFFSHKGDYAIDFKVKEGTKIMAARSGVVTFSRKHFTHGGIGRIFVGTGNGISIKHADGTYAHYWHLQHNGALVNVGDTVEQGQWIGLSGDTGFSAFPHLHFEVTRQPRISREDFPVLFFTKNGPKFLQPLRWYTSL
jgi:murein DD-endopeptidase MepM/ murein hydrolase activator NlpD